MKIMFLISGDRVPSSRFRVLPFVPHLRRDGHRVCVAASFPQKYDYFPWLGFRPSQMLKRLVRTVQLLRCRWGRYDLVFLERELFDNDRWDVEAGFRKSVPAFVLDVDDGIFLRYPEKFEKLVDMSDLVIAGNRFLEERIHGLGARSIVIPTCVEMKSYVPRDWEAAQTGPAVVGWMGTTGNLNYLKVVAGPLRRLAERCAFELRLIAPDRGPLSEIDLTGISVTFIPWRGATEVEELRKLDVGMMPLFADDEWNRYKCGLKLIQYMAVGVPGVASPVGVNADIVEHGVDGFLASTEEEWEETLLQLIEDRALRQRIGAKARAKVAEKYSIEANYPFLERALRETLERVTAGA